jgi:hypothetical protein
MMDGEASLECRLIRECAIASCTFITSNTLPKTKCSSGNRVHFLISRAFAKNKCAF